MAEIGDVLLLAEPIDHLFDQPVQFGRLRVESARIQVALQCDVLADQLTGESRAHRPVHADHIEIVFALGQLLDRKVIAVLAVENDRHQVDVCRTQTGSNLLNNSLQKRQREFAEQIRRQVAEM